ncbi:2-hydroxyacid dehydrogenase [Sulfitobacter aestuariivivens]|uniref:2-hydroxyacid dehydrogenase n=1 Tax=Sulfitobacter aestuariivivens TaxID=2766981 RepID=A0A927D8F8_9RHOB|nr:2-hydroxyacid dehydrogenase [Sulfitobacter aestuariivivens]MBD3666073.1 2-hydroxyacid dehydrogenase [Sulfitobacter aestuariivivens]
MTKTLAIGHYTADEAAELGAAFGPHCVASSGDVAKIELAARSQISVVAFKDHDPFGASEMDALPQLQLIANYGVGFDAIDMAAARARGIRVTNTPDVLNDDVADLAIAMWLAQGRQMRAAETWVREGQWQRGAGPVPLNRKMSGGVAGIMGMGRIGRAIADRLAAFGTEIHYHARGRKETPGWTFQSDPVALAEAVDFLFVALVGGSETKNYVSAEVINALGPRGVLINISRGSTVDEGALLDALENGKLAGAGLDVFLNEPRIDPRFLALENVVLQPHQGSGTSETRAAMAQLQRDNIAAHFAGTDLLTPVN